MIGDQGVFALPENGGTYEVFEKNCEHTVIFHHGITGGYSKNGGGVYNEGSVTVTGGSVINNSGKEGGGIYNCSTGVVALGGSGKVTANKSSESSGGGIANYGTLSVSDNAEISCNYGYTDGGGIINNGTVNIYDGITSLLKKQAVL